MKILSCKSRRQKAVGLYELNASSMPTVNSNHYCVASVSVHMAYKQMFFKPEHLKAVTVNITVFWNVTLCRLLEKYMPLEEPIFSICPEDGGIVFLRNVGINIPEHTALNRRR